MKNPEISIKKKYRVTGLDEIEISHINPEYVNHLESERKKLIDSLVEVQDSHVMSDGLTLISDQTKDKIKTALRDAEEES